MDDSICNIPLPSEVTVKSSSQQLKEETSGWIGKKNFDDPDKYNDLQLDSFNPESEDIIDLHPGILEAELNETSDKESVEEPVPVPNIPNSPAENKISLKLVSKPLLIRRPTDSSTSLNSNLKQVFENPSDYEYNSNLEEEEEDKTKNDDKVGISKSEKKTLEKIDKSENRDRGTSKREKDSDSLRSKSPVKKRSPRKDRDKKDDDRSKSRSHYDSKDKEKIRGDKEKSSKLYNDRRRPSPQSSRGRAIRSGSPWENERSRSRSKDRSPSFSRSPRRLDVNRDRDKKFDDDRFAKGKFPSDRRDRANRSPIKYKGRPFLLCYNFF